jgi:transcriptional regulator with XRE-family HTH domain
MGVVNFLSRELERRKQRNARYSLRAFARDLDCDHATLSQWLRGTRPMSHAAEEHLFARLDLDADERNRAREIEEDDLRVIAAMATEPTTTHELAAASGLPVDRANIALSKLLRLNLAKLDQGKWQLLGEVR